MKVKMYDYEGNIKKDIELPVGVVPEKMNEDLLRQYVRTYLLNQRQGTVKTKGRGEVRGGGKKPWKQKGTGRARVGSSRSPLWVGGGIIHGPSPKDWCISLSKKMKKQAFQHAFYLKSKDNVLCAFEYESKKKNSYSTKDAMFFLKAVGEMEGVLIIHNNKGTLYKSFRNIPAVNIKEVESVNAYDLINAKKIIVERNSVNLLLERLK